MATLPAASCPIPGNYWASPRRHQPQTLLLPHRAGLCRPAQRYTIFGLPPTRDCAASTLSETDSDRPAGVPTLRWAPPKSTGTGRHPFHHRMPVHELAQPVLEQRQRHDQRYQPLPVVLDEAQELQPTAGRPCPHWTGGSSSSPSSAGERSHAWPRPLRLQPITPRPSMSWAPYSAVNSLHSRLPASATRRPISV
jgi:hypothetical protein